MCSTPTMSAAQEVIFSVAISLKDAVEELGLEFQRTRPAVVLRLNLGASGELQKQIEAGAPVDLFISAAERQMDELVGNRGPAVRVQTAPPRSRPALAVLCSSGLDSRARDLMALAFARSAQNQEGTMKLVRFGRAGNEKPGLIDTEGKLRDLSRVLQDITAEALQPAVLRRLRALKPARLPLVKGTPRLGCPLAGIGKIVCIGLNYVDHAAEVGRPLPKESSIFLKATSAINGPNDPIIRPKDSVKLDYEVELAAVIGKETRNVDASEALGRVAAYCLMNDVSERAFQMERGGDTTKGKSGDTFAPIGPWLVTADEVADPQAVALWTTVNGERRQDGNTRHMVFSVRELVAYVSRFMSLQAGDLLSTGTPAGVGHGDRPPRYLRPKDIVEMGIDGLGTQRHVVVEWNEARRKR